MPLLFFDVTLTKCRDKISVGEIIVFYNRLKMETVFMFSVFISAFYL